MNARERKTVALYARVSTADQNCEMQLDDLRRFAVQRFGPAYEYVDIGVSGAQRHRPKLDALLKDARKRLFDVVLVWKFDRFARSVKHLVDSLEEFRALGIDFVSYTEGVDTTTPTGQLLFHIVGAVAQFERDLIAERVRAGIAHARALGRRIGRPRAEIDTEQVNALRRQGRSLRQIAQILSVPVSRVRRALATSKEASRRILPLPQPVLRALLALHDQRSGKSDLELVFSTSKGTSLSDTNLLHRELKPAGRKIGTPWLGWHTLRRTHATLLQAAGGSLKDAQAQLGHTKLSTTLEIYTVPIPAHQRAAVENLARLVTNGDELEQCAGKLPETTQQIQ